MKALFGIGLVVLILGVISFFVPIPREENHGVKIGDAKIGVQTQHSERLAPVVSIVVVVVGAGLMIAGKKA